jgi:hypothetical protein
MIRTLSQWKTPKPSAATPTEPPLTMLRISLPLLKSLLLQTRRLKLATYLNPFTWHCHQQPLKLPSLGASAAHAAPQAHIGLKTLREIATKVHAEIDANPKNDTNEDLKLYQIMVSKLQKTVGANTAGASHPELEEELQEIAKIEPKVESGTVTKGEANHLRSLEARAHGHTEKGGVTSHAQSVAAEKARSVSISTAKDTPTSASNIQGHAGRFDPAEQS